MNFNAQPTTYFNCDIRPRDAGASLWPKWHENLEMVAFDAFKGLQLILSAGKRRTMIAVATEIFSVPLVRVRAANS